ncbi:SdpI family protein [Desulfovibrio aminophilus]|uniref:SdpI family protein n=1 Tax=Desulfovibrio aminophilus TaxID=81425 RepID=UPI003392C8C1
MLIWIGILFFILGVIFRVFPPRSVNGIYGYRTPRSMKNQDTWHEAQRFTADNLTLYGLLFAGTGLLLELVLGPNSGPQTVIFLAGLAVMIFQDERHLLRSFHPDGSRKETKPEESAGRSASRGLGWAAAVSGGLSLCSLAAFRLTGSSVDGQGFLHEPFALAPIGALLAGFAVLMGLAALLVRFAGFFSSPRKDRPET